MIQCKINGIVHILKVLISKYDKCEGLKKYNFLPANQGVIFVYDKDDESKYDFSEIGYDCKIYFLNSDFSIIHQEKTSAYQDKLVSCAEPFRYVIEIGGKN